MQRRKYHPSGIILLALIKKDLDYKGILKWDESHHNLMRKHKKNIINSEGQHHGSTGKIYSYGNTANFGLVGKSSITHYANRKCNRLSHYKGLCLEELSQMEMQCGIANLSNYIPLLPKLISPIIDVAFNLQQSQGDILLKEITGSKDGLWQTSMCVNAETQQFHTECDCTYTLIHVSQQVRKNNPAEYYFNFNLMKERTFSIQMKASTSILFSGQHITHSQACSVVDNHDDNTFFNFASYGNARLFNHIRKSFERMNENN